MLLLGPGGGVFFFFSFFCSADSLPGGLGTWVLELHDLPGISDSSTIDTGR